MKPKISPLFLCNRLDLYYRLNQDPEGYGVGPPTGNKLQQLARAAAYAALCVNCFPLEKVNQTSD